MDEKAFQKLEIDINKLYSIYISQTEKKTHTQIILRKTFSIY